MFRKVLVLGMVLLMTLCFAACGDPQPANKSYEKDANRSTKDLAKPVVYLYPEKELKATVKLSHPEDIICEYPKYGKGWNVKAEPDGDLTDLRTGKKYYSLYYEADSGNKHSVNDEGFVVKSNDIAEFLDEKLSLLGLNYREREEFIIYWLPILQKDKYAYIRFLSENEIDKMQKLTVNPKPDTMIRVCMGYKNLDEKISVREQKLKPVSRDGFTVVEWGGLELIGR